MSILDNLNVFTDNVALTATGISDTIDLGDDSVTRNIGGPDAIYLVIKTGTLPTDAGSDATFRARLVSDSTANLATSPTTHVDTGVLAFAAFAAANRTLLVAPLPLGDYERFLGVQYDIAGGPLTGGTFSAFLTRAPQFWRAFTANNPTWK